MLQSEARNPRLITYLAYVMWSFPVSYVLLMGTFYNLPFARIISLFFSFVYIVHSVLAVFIGFALYRLRPYAWHLYVFHTFVMIGEQFYVGYRFAENHVVEIPIAFMSVSALIVLLLLKRELRVPYFSPKIAWWESDPRYKISVPAQMTCSDHFYKGDIMDISSSGCFIKTKDPLKVDQEIKIKFSLFDHKFDCSGRVVWRTESGVTHPKGVGVRFTALEKNVHADLRETVKKLKNLSRRYQNIRAEEKAVTIERKVEALISQRKG
ncbi:MAG: PilZ domain-containing protein [Bacteriovoracia bacterium]